MKVFQFLLPLAFLSATITAADRPNVLLIMVDDMGFSDLGCYGGEIETPNLDALAAKGLRYSQFYNTGRCWSTRASLMTGRYPHEVGHAMMNRKKATSPAYRGMTKANGPFVSELLQAAGYRTYHVGKWHLKTRGWPLDAGFERSYCIKRQDNYFNPVEILDEGKSVKRPGEKDNAYYVTDALNERTTAYLTEHFEKNADAPFFLYLAHTAPHFPLHAPEDTVRKYVQRYHSGWDEIRKQRLARLKKQGLLDGASDLSARDPDAEEWDSMPDTEKENWAIRMAIHAAMVDHVDQGIGKIVETLKTAGQLENTLILFLSDNGASAEYLIRGDGHDPGAAPGSAWTYLCLEVGWANASNTPFRMHKIWNHEGGISTPLIVHWPTGLKKKPHAITHEITHVIDIVPTILQAGGAAIPKKISGLALPSLVAGGKPRGAEDPVFWEHSGNRAIRMGDWKLVAERAKSWELYDLLKDRTEMKNQIEAQPEKAAELEKTWQEWADRVGVVLETKARQHTEDYREK